jgi:serine/threonine protein kinase
MNTARWERTKQILDEALKIAPEQRNSYLDSQCGEDTQLRAELKSLIASYEEAGSHFLDPALSQMFEIADSAEQDIHGQKMIGHYRLLQQIGKGGMGQVWLADQLEPVRRRVALKLIKTGMYDDDLLRRFQLERQSLAIMDHPSIAKILDAGATPEGQPYFVMEYVPGYPITDYCDQKRLKIRERLEVFIQACEAVQHAHQKAIIHRDLKPANILVQEIDGKPLARIIDFGLAKAISPELGQSRFTHFGGFVGTPGYMSPEQYEADIDVDTRSDVYSLGVVLYVLLTGYLPFQAKPGKEQRFEEILGALRENAPPRPSAKVSTDRETAHTLAKARATEPPQLVKLLRGDLDWITMRALERERARRYATVSDFAADLRRYLQNEPVMAGPASLRYRAGKFVRRNRLAVATASVAFSAILLISVLAIYQARIAQRRFQDVRKLAHVFVFDLHDEIAKLEGSTKAREMMVETGREYLDKLAQSAGRDMELQNEIARAYMKIGDAQGYPTKPNLGRVADAIASYKKAGAIYQKIAVKDPANLPALAKYYLQYGGLVRYEHDFKQAREMTQLAIETLDRIGAHQELGRDAVQDYMRAWCMLGELDEDVNHFREAWAEYSKCASIAREAVQKSRDRETLTNLARADERIGTAAQALGRLSDSLHAFDEDEAVVRELLAAEPQNPVYHRLLAITYHYRANVYYDDISPSFGDAGHALENERRYLKATEEMVKSDPSNSSAQFSRAIAMYAVSFCLANSDANGAIKLARNSVALFDHMIVAGKSSYLVPSRRVRALIRLAGAQLKAGRLAEARATAESALSKRKGPLPRQVKPIGMMSTRYWCRRSSSPHRQVQRSATSRARTHI